MRDGVYDHDMTLDGVDERIGKTVEYVALGALECGPHAGCLDDQGDSAIDFAQERLGSVGASLEVPLEPGVDVEAGAACKFNL